MSTGTDSLRRKALSRIAAALGAVVAPTLLRSAEPPARPRQPRMIDWVELLPEKERLLPGSDELAGHDYLSEDGPRRKQSGSAATNPGLNGVYARVPGYVVPLALSEPGVVSECLLVPYFGACIHVPPPPPNQTIHVMLQPPARVKTILIPYWITGVLSVAQKNTPLAATAYSLAGEKLEKYEY